MYWTLELASWLEDAPWPATKDELIDYAMRSGAPMEVIENLQEIEGNYNVYPELAHRAAYERETPLVSRIKVMTLAIDALDNMKQENK